eukprot:TRINITY_DN6891_c0_g1_i1.p1 TRINITY_DN6891_c0_g1~~TRINITY_DN6891_c0_g1_i1.p1  ORF type:complete len:135 (+),score=39.51 TRINITY_DN6891_c0_g1_i1:199-603(+)
MAVQDAKEKRVDSQIKEALKKIDSIDKWTETACRTIDEKNQTIEFLSQVETYEEDIRNMACITDPQIEKHWFTMPQLRFRFFEESLKTLKYTEKNIPIYASGPLNGGPFSGLMEGELESADLDLNELAEFEVEF